MLFNLYIKVNNAMCTPQLTKLQISVPWSARFVIPPLANMKAYCAWSFATLCTCASKQPRVFPVRLPTSANSQSLLRQLTEHCNTGSRAIVSILLVRCLADRICPFRNILAVATLHMLSCTYRSLSVTKRYQRHTVDNFRTSVSTQKLHFYFPVGHTCEGGRGFRWYFFQRPSVVE